MFATRADLARVTAALDADPFADPVRVLGIPLPRKEARRIERELTAKFPSGRTEQAGSVQPRPGHPILTPGAQPVVPEPQLSPPGGGSGLSFDRGPHAALHTSQVQYDHQ
ncbi:MULTISPECIES: hypothetical protein [unclassified Novosphingobium]|uniref:hypothetical protein n=1 Tax=unclassified Novosphingobium TaxID=2644732 RepID=UPI00135B8E0E|nr:MULTISPECIES: hypothetical protein [unclassified Novosphingobium]